VVMGVLPGLSLTAAFVCYSTLINNCKFWFCLNIAYSCRFIPQGAAWKVRIWCRAFIII
jgi:hypothetical protein